MLTGELPLGSFAPPSAKGPAGCDRRADAVIRRALAPDPADRFASVAELGQAVRTLVPRKPHPRKLTLAAALVFMIVGGGAVAMTQIGDRSTPRAQASDPDAASIAATSTDAFVAEPDAAPIAPADASVPTDAAVVAEAPPRPKPKPTSKPKPPTKPTPTKMVNAGGGKSKANSSGLCVGA